MCRDFERTCLKNDRKNSNLVSIESSRNGGIFMQLGVSEKGVLLVDSSEASGKSLKKHIKLSTIFSHGFVQEGSESKESFFWFTVGNPHQVYYCFDLLLFWTFFFIFHNALTRSKAKVAKVINAFSFLCLTTVGC